MSSRDLSADALPRRVAVVLFPGFELLDVAGPVELLSKVEGVTIEHVGPAAGPVMSANGVSMVADLAHEGLSTPDILLLPGGAGTRPLAEDGAFLAWLRRTGQAARLVASVCTGSALLAAAGLLDGRPATTNKLAYDWATAQGPGVEWRPRARWVADGDRWTSSGVSAGMDMTAALIAELWGPGVADAVCRRVEYTPHRDPDDDPFAVGLDGSPGHC